VFAAAAAVCPAQDIGIRELQQQLLGIFTTGAVTPEVAAAPSNPNLSYNPYAIVEREYLYAFLRDIRPALTFPRIRNIRSQPPPIVRTYAACVKVITPRWHGAGFLVSPDGDVVTCYHLIAGAPTATVQTVDGRLYPIRQITAFSPAMDLAVVKIAGGPFPYVPIDTALKPPEPETPLFTIGHPQDHSWVLVPGAVIRWQTENNVPLLHFDANVLRGNSGGPVIDAEGRLLAVTAYAARLADGSQVKVGISWAAVRDLLGPGGYRAARRQPLSFDEIAVFQRNCRAVEFLQLVYGVGEEFMSELRLAMSRVTIESLAQPPGRGVLLVENPADRATRITLRNTRDCAEVAAKLLLLKALTDRCIGTATLEPDVAASVDHFQTALDGFIDGVCLLDRARGATTRDANATLKQLQRVCFDAQRRLSTALGTFHDSALRYDLPQIDPGAFERMDVMRRRYTIPDELLTPPQTGV
jgi:hypothetical protein